MAEKAEVTPSMLRSEERAEQITEAQIQTALRLNAKYFDGEGLAQVGAILQALATNYHASVLFSKVVK